MRTDPPRDTRFKPGQSGNPAGRPKGSRNKITVLAQAMVEEEAPELVRSYIDGAKAGKPVPQRITGSVIFPPHRYRSVEIELPATDTSTGVAAAQSALVRQVAEGEICPEQGATVSKMLDATLRALDAADLDVRVRRIEEQLGLAPPADPAPTGDPAAPKKAA
jgi:hypothetical protein